ncbi:MAG: nucleotidyltransferase family protein [Deltaproteobacteria bacterium]|nr:nucleotidyltransferase family protein [Deltaproteobacteria bacterium]
MSVDAVLLIGDTGKSVPIRGENKNFLMLKDTPLFLHVLDCLQKSRWIKRTFIVGDRTRVETLMRKSGRKFTDPKDIVVLEQGESLIENALIALRKAEELDGGSRLGNGAAKDEEAVLFLSGDIPLVTSYEIDGFIEKCDLHGYDYFVGVCPEKALKPFYSSGESPGIKMAYFYLKEAKYRHNNLHLTKPSRIKNIHFIQRVYDYRYQKDVGNFGKLLGAFCRDDVRAKNILFYLVLHLNLLLSRYGFEFLTALFRRLTSMHDIESAIGETLGVKFKLVEMTTAGAAIDIDSERDYEAMEVMYDSWRAYLEDSIPPEIVTQSPL